MLIVVAPAAMAASTQRHRKSGSVRVPSSALHSTSSVLLRASATLDVTSSSTCAGSMRSFTRMCSGLVETKVWMRRRAAGFTASAARRMSAGAVRARPHTTGPSFAKRVAMACTLSKSPADAMGKPASITSTPSSASASAMRSFSSRFMEKPGDCSPSRSVVSKTMTRSSGRAPKEGWCMVMAEARGSGRWLGSSC